MQKNPSMVYIWMSDDIIAITVYTYFGKWEEDK